MRNTLRLRDDGQISAYTEEFDTVIFIGEHTEYIDWIDDGTLVCDEWIKANYVIPREDLEEAKEVFGVDQVAGLDADKITTPAYETLTPEILHDIEYNVRDFLRKQFDDRGLRLPGIKTMSFLPEYKRHLQKEGVIPPKDFDASEFGFYLIELLINNQYLDGFDERVKRCGYCGFPFRDTAGNNSAKYCGVGCKDAYHSDQSKAAYKAKKEAEGKTVGRPSKKDRFYNKALGYWMDEDEMVAYTEQHESSFSTEYLEGIDGAIQRKAESGEYYNPKKRERTPFDYDGKSNISEQLQGGYARGGGRMTDGETHEVESYRIGDDGWNADPEDDDDFENDGTTIVDLEDYEREAYGIYDDDDDGELYDDGS